MQTPKARKNSTEGPPRFSPRAVRQLSPPTLEIASASSSKLASRTPKDRSPKVTERRSPRSPVSELQRKRPSRISELESQISQLQDDLKKVKDQLSSAESWKKRAQQEAEDSKKQLLDMSLKLEESQKQLSNLSASETAQVGELQKISRDSDLAWQSELEVIQKQRSVDSAALTSAVNEIQRLKDQLETVAESEAAQKKNVESAEAELHSLKGNLADTLSLVENMKNQLRDCKESEAQAQELVGETLLQLETAKRTVETLRLDGIKAKEAYNSIAVELDQSKAHVNQLEEVVNKLKANINSAGSIDSESLETDPKIECEATKNEKITKSSQLEAELTSLKMELGQLRTVLETSEIKYNEEQIQNMLHIRSTNELVEQIKAASSLREAELDAELDKTKANIEELKANLMDKETELQGISEENEELHMKLENSLTCQIEYEQEKDLKKLEEVEDLKANLMDKETELQIVLEENEMLKSKIRGREMDKGKAKDEIVAEVEATRAAEREALVKLGYMTQEAEKSNRRAARVAEQLEAAQAATSEMEADLRRLKVQSDQWRKAAEAAVAMLSTANNGKFMDRTGSLDSSYNPAAGKISLPYSEEFDDDLLRKKNGNMLKKIGVLWKKPQK
ncbi:interactor of constitutive active ROPs 3 isoform X2 [Diospyros lotus]|uniref:interactor of constitutive active ROPs 3 isoform X2 n=1 Tax=Diospyros lotus TaxID=55363 RepID=UPI00224D5AD1|nr:interactor of constitutive active ROPs 3 isoform X2 [Diospyros lotus]XP_052187575.1 interactor of constitutive active ROPs 3 isoform X2 [Diospyros lotus]XP_052187576.1 interactor of constitutive active ROPs 3 isoform X2 [Diospyros lotus]XP_052187578.1 interactor of constitutive active ROPs 3 isoform X2 [Diospyros lotus]XP_052187579.1 interactor of constitutive active ROPs 3 isoform X2 [Diospyros lotus]XP_052187580.1 interactor of constitutive active ROPs 3 isoform X2 [Diospyros lotus]